MKQTKILLVCPGNLIRSAFGEAILSQYAREYSLPWIVHSAGTNRWFKGRPADPRAVAAAHLNRLDLTSHVTRRFKPHHFEDYDIIYSMSAESTRYMRRVARNSAHLSKIQNFMDILYPGEGRDVPNPWFEGTELDFLHCFETIDLICRLLVHRSMAA